MNRREFFSSPSAIAAIAVAESSAKQPPHGCPVVNCAGIMTERLASRIARVAFRDPAQRMQWLFAEPVIHEVFYRYSLGPSPLWAAEPPTETTPLIIKTAFGVWGVRLFDSGTDQVAISLASINGPPTLRVLHCIDYQA